jgi:hypothetical protein
MQSLYGERLAITRWLLALGADAWRCRMEQSQRPTLCVRIEAGDGPSEGQCLGVLEPQALRYHARPKRQHRGTVDLDFGHGSCARPDVSWCHAKYPRCSTLTTGSASAVHPGATFVRQTLTVGERRHRGTDATRSGSAIDAAALRSTAVRARAEASWRSSPTRPERNRSKVLRPAGDRECTASAAINRSPPASEWRGPRHGAAGSGALPGPDIPVRRESLATVTAGTQRPCRRRDDRWPSAPARHTVKQAATRKNPTRSEMPRIEWRAT